MNRRLAELDRLEFGVVPVRRSPRSKPLTTLVVLVIGVGGLLSVWLLSGGSGTGQRSVVAGGPAASNTVNTPRISGAPTRSHLAHPHRLLPAATAPAARSTSYRMFPGVDGARWEPCRPIHYVVRRGGEGRQLDTLLHSAVAEVRAATGLVFVDDGTTSELPLYSAGARLPYLPSMYGDRWAPVLVAWSNSSESPSLANAEGRAGPVPWSAPGEPSRYVSGTVSFDTPKMLALLKMQNGSQWARTVVLHELGHLVGLAHVRDRTQVMHPGYAKPPILHYAAGDRAGLAQLGRGPCYSDF